MALKSSGPELRSATKQNHYSNSRAGDIQGSSSGVGAADYLRWKSNFEEISFLRVMKTNISVRDLTLLSHYGDTNKMTCEDMLYPSVGDPVEPLANDHPHQRPSLSYDHISCDGQWFLFVYESSRATIPLIRPPSESHWVLLYI